MQESPPKQVNIIIGVNSYLKCLNCIKLEKYTSDLVVLIKENHILHYFNNYSDNNSIFSVFLYNFNIFVNQKTENQV